MLALVSDRIEASIWSTGHVKVKTEPNKLGPNSMMILFAQTMYLSGMENLVPRKTASKATTVS